MRLLLAVLFASLLSSCAAPSAPQTPLAPVYALQDAQATGTAASRNIEATATAQMNAVTTQLAQLINLAVMQTSTAIPQGQTATAQYLVIQVATATEGAQYRATAAHATAESDRLLFERRDDLDWAFFWLSAGVASPIVVFLCAGILKVGRAFAARQRIIYGNGLPVGLLMADRYLALPSGSVIENPPVPSIEFQCRLAWREALKVVAREAEIRRSWSVNELARGTDPIASEDTVIACQQIARDLGAITDTGGNRGYQWVPGWGYLPLAQAVDSGADFGLPLKAPRSPDGRTSLKWPNLSGQSNTTRSKATISKGEVVR